MATFIGEYACKVDNKGRIMLPSAFKKQLSSAALERFVVKKDIFEKCLVLYPIEEWERQNILIRSKVNPYNKEHSQFLREFYKGTAELELDATNRFLLPKRLMEMAGIEDEVYLSGQDRKIEIWSKSVYENTSLQHDELGVLAEKILGGSLNFE